MFLCLYMLVCNKAGKLSLRCDMHFYIAANTLIYVGLSPSDLDLFHSLSTIAEKILTRSVLDLFPPRLLVRRQLLMSTCKVSLIYLKAQ